jgi:hypothetical protein
MDANGNITFNSYGYETKINLHILTVDGLDFRCTDIYETIRMANLYNNLRQSGLEQGETASIFEVDG